MGRLDIDLWPNVVRQDRQRLTYGKCFQTHCPLFAMTCVCLSVRLSVEEVITNYYYYLS